MKKPEDELLPEISPCPFCGGPAELVLQHREYFVQCADVKSDCFVHAYTGNKAKENEAISIWNKRPERITP